MFEVVVNLLMHKQLNFEKGKIVLFDQRIAMLPLYNVVELQKTLEQQKFENALYYINKTFGISWTKKMHESFKVKEKDVFKLGIDSVTLAGWGIVEVVSVKTNPINIKFNLKDSGVVFYYGSSENPVDHIFRGMIAGAMSATYSVDLDAVEISCKSQGKDYCEFVVKETKDFDFSNPLIKKQLTKPGG